MLDFRFDKGILKGHNLGNILLAGMQEKSIDVDNLFDIRANLLPVALKRARLCVRLENGKTVKSETKIDEVIGYDGRLKIIKAWVEPKVRINPEVCSAILKADMIVMGPGDLYTSVGACLVILGVAKAIRDSRAKKVYVCNLMTKFGQSNNFSVQDHAQVIQNILGGNVLQYVIYNKKRPSKSVLDYYKKHKENLVELSDNENRDSIEYIGVDLLGPIYKKSKADVLVRSLIRHDSDKLARILFKTL